MEADLKCVPHVTKGRYFCFFVYYFSGGEIMAKLVVPLNFNRHEDILSADFI